MNQHFMEFIKLGRNLIEDKGFNWKMFANSEGIVRADSIWNLNKLVDDNHPPTMYLRDFGCDSKTLALINQSQIDLGLAEISNFVLSSNWQDLIKSSVSVQLFSKRNSVSHVSQNIIRPLRVIATCANKTEPWSLTVDDMRRSVTFATKVQSSGKLGDLVIGVIKTIFDTYHLTDAGPLYPSLSESRLQPSLMRKAKFIKSEDELRHDLEDRKREERLPERKAFWELIRIVMTEKPKTFVDELRFIGIKTMIATGFRIGENTLLPLDWERRRQYVDRNGKPSGESGGFSESLMIRHFAEKQHINGDDSRILFETVQYVPLMFEEMVVESLNRAIELTSPLRSTLKRQIETGRLLPWYERHELMPVVQLYTHLTGNPFWIATTDEERQYWLGRYKEKFNASVLDDLRDWVNRQYSGATPGKLDMAAYMYFNRFSKAIEQWKISFRLSDGTPIHNGVRMRWNETFINVGEIEDYLRKNVPTKNSDIHPFKLDSGDLQSWEILFLHPKRSLAEERNGGLCDVNRYMSINVPDSTLLANALSNKIPSSENLFEKYGQNEDDRKLHMTSHSLRHLQNTELFRLGVADTIISKRFNRRSVVQSYEYDHRSLAEELDTMELPHEVEFALGGKAVTVAKMIMSGKAHGPIVDAFNRIQKNEGDQAAFEYLRAEADGFHATPYGHCLNSFTVDPCPKHLECFSGCRHLSATNLPEQRDALIRLEGKLATSLQLAREKPTKSIGRRNQIDHIGVRLDGVRKILSSESGTHPFPNGPDLSIGKKMGILDE